MNEARTNWRPYLLGAVSAVIEASGSPTQIDSYSISEVTLIINKGIWNGSLGKSIIFKGGQTPLIYDPMSILVFGYASCTGVSIVLIDALRSVGIPARLAGTPAWHGDAANGNHNWVEIWIGQSDEGEDIWQFIEASPAGAGESLDNPCDKWFCRAANMNGTEGLFLFVWDNLLYIFLWDDFHLFSFCNSLAASCIRALSNGLGPFKYGSSGCSKDCRISGDV